MKKKSVTVVTGAAVVGIAAGALANASVLQNLFEPGKFQKFEKQDENEDYDYVSGDGDDLDLADQDNDSQSDGGKENQQYLKQTDTWSELQNDESSNVPGLGLADLSTGDDTGNVNGNAIQFTEDPVNASTGVANGGSIIKSNISGNTQTSAENGNSGTDSNTDSILKPNTDQKEDNSKADDTDHNQNNSNNNGSNGKDDKEDPQEPEESWEDGQLKKQDPIETEDGQLLGITAVITKDHYVLTEKFQAQDATVTATYLKKDGTKTTKELSYGGTDGYHVSLATEKSGTQMATFTYQGVSTQTSYYVSENYVVVFYHAAFSDDSAYYTAAFPGTPLMEEEGYTDVRKLVQTPANCPKEGDLIDLTAVHSKMIAFLGDEQIASTFAGFTGENYKDVVFLQEKDGYLTTMLSGFSYVYNKVLQDEKTYVYYPGNGWNEGQRNVIDKVVAVPEGYKIRRTVMNADSLKSSIGNQVLEGYEGEDTTLSVPMGVTQIEMKMQSPQVTKMEIPQSVQEVDFASIAENLPNLKEYVAADESRASGDYLIEDGVIYSKDGKTLVSVPARKTSFEVPARVTTLAENCFAGSTEDTKITFAGSDVPKISGKTGLKGTVTVPDSEGDLVRKSYQFAFGTENEQIEFVTETHKTADYVYSETTSGEVLRSKEDPGILMGIPTDTAGYYQTDDTITGIGAYAFYGCKNLTDIELGENVTQLQKNSLVLEDHVESIQIKGGQVTIDPQVFGDGSCLNYLKIYISEDDYPHYIYVWTKVLDPVYGDQTTEKLLQTKNSTYLYEDGAKYQKIELENGEITYRLLKVYETDRTEITVREQTTEIAEGAFDDCSRMEVLNLPASLEKVPSAMLRTCNALELVTRQSEKVSLADTQMPAQTQVFTVGTDFRGFISEGNAVYGENFSGGYTLLDVKTNAAGTVSIKAQTTAIGKRAFANCQSFTEIWAEDPTSVQTIGEEAFRNSGMNSTVDLTSFTGLQSIGSYAFAECGDMPELLLPDQLTQIPADLCYACDKLTKIQANGVQTIGAEAFWGCSWLRSLEGMDQLAELGDRAFYGCGSLSVIILPETLTKMGESCFANCTSLTRAEVNGTITGISRYCFYGCSALTDIKFGEKTKETIQVIGVQAFAGCTKLESLDLTALTGLTRMGERTFASCSNLTTIRLPENLQKLPDSCMEDCENLSIVQLTGETLPELGDRVFGETMLPFVHLWVNENQVDNCRNTYREKLDQAYGEGTVDTIIEKTDEKIEYIRGVEFEWTEEGRVLKKAAKELSGSYVVPENTVAIAADAFRECQNLTQIEIPTAANIRLGDRCFKGCQGLQTVLINGTITEWGEETFMDCTGISQIQIGAPNVSPAKQIEKIGDRAFMNCTGLTTSGSVAIRTVASVWGKECFAGCSNLPNVGVTSEVRSAVTEIQDRAFYGCTKLTALLTSQYSGLQTIGAYAFSECDTLKQPSVPAGVTSIGEGCFMNCDNLTYVSFYCGLEEYPKYCFKNCPKLVRTGGTAAAFAGLKRIGEGAYEGCSSLVNSTSWYLGRYSSLQEIGERAFAGCTSLGDSILQATIQKIGSQAFTGCTQMHTLQILAATPPAIGSWTREELAQDLIIRVTDSEADGDSIYMAYLEVLKTAVGEKNAYEMLDSLSDGAMERNKPKVVDETEEIPGEDSQESEQIPEDTEQKETGTEENHTGSSGGEEQTISAAGDTDSNTEQTGSDKQENKQEPSADTAKTEDTEEPKTTQESPAQSGEPME